MSTKKTAPQKAPARLAKRNVEFSQPSAAQPSAMEDIEVTSLQIDDSYDGDCDPYNCTGQFLADALKEKYGD